MAKRELQVVITGDATGAKRAFGQVDDVAGKTGDSIVTKLKGSLGKVGGFGTALAGGLLGGGVVAGFTGLQSAVSGVIAEYQESIKIGRETERVIRTTGGAANVTADYVEKLSGKMSEKRGIDDETIQGGANLLLTFTNVRNELGKGNKVFDQAVRLSGDMAVSLGTDQKNAAVQLGKALNDPIKGITALSRSGVSFTEQQKEQIKALVESGDVLGAQKIILGELKKEFGGAAEAAATPLDKLKVKLANFQEAIGVGFAGLVTKITPHIQEAISWVQTHWPEIEQAIERGMRRVQEIVAPILAIVETLWHNFGDNILNFVRNVWPPIQQVISGALEFIRGIVNTVLAIISGDWSGAWEGIKQILSGAWEAIKGIVGVAIEYVQLIIGVAWEIISSAAGAAWEGIKSVISGGIDAVVGFVSGLPGRIGGFAFDMLMAGISLGGAVIDGIKSGISAAAGFAGDIAEGILSAFKSGWNAVANEINNFIPNEVGFDTPFGFIGVNLPDNPIPRFHSGGVVPGRPGSEMLAILQAGERVIPASAAASSAPTGAPARSYTLHFNVAPTADLSRVGAEMIEAIKAYERQNGNVWEPA